MLATFERMPVNETVENPPGRGQLTVGCHRRPNEIVVDQAGLHRHAGRADDAVHEVVQADAAELRAERGLHRLVTEELLGLVLADGAGRHAERRLDPLGKEATILLGMDGRPSGPCGAEDFKLRARLVPTIGDGSGLDLFVPAVTDPADRPDPLPFSGKLGSQARHGLLDWRRASTSMSAVAGGASCGPSLVASIWLKTFLRLSFWTVLRSSTSKPWALSQSENGPPAVVVGSSGASSACSAVAAIRARALSSAARTTKLISPRVDSRAT